MLRNITIFDAQEIQSISNFELGYDVNLDIVKKQIRRLTNDNKHNIQGQGIGKKLMSAIEDYALENNISYIRLNSNVRRIDAHKFYESIGYVCDKTQKRLIKKL